MYVKLGDIYHAALEQAVSDGVISAEERQVLDQLRIDIDQVREKLSEVQTGDPGYLRELDSVKARIVQNAIKVVLEDGYASDNERDILRKISESLDSYYP